VHLALARGHPQQADAVGVGGEVEVVADVHGLDQEAELLGELLAHAADARHQLSALGTVHERDQPVADLQADDVHRLHVVPGELALLGPLRLRLLRLLLDQLSASPGRAPAAR